MRSGTRLLWPKPFLYRQSRRALLFGFGGLLLLVGFAGLDTARALRQVQARSGSIQQEFLQRSRLLNEIRSDVYVTGTYVRDYLLEPEPANAEKYRGDLNRIHREMDLTLNRYAGSLAPAEQTPFRGLRQRLADYWQLLDPVFQWDTEERLSRGYAFLRDEVFPRRVIMLGLADQIAAVNEKQLTEGNERVAGVFSQFRTRFGVTLLVTLTLGLLLAVASSSRILALERQGAERLDQVVEARGELKSLSARLVEAQETERKAISRELHDEVGQSVSALLVGLMNVAANIPESAKATLGPQVSELRKLAEGNLAVIRNMALLLRPSMLDDFGLVPALQWQAREVGRRTGLLVNVAAEQVPDDLPEEHKTCVYRVVQEALHNASRHANAHMVRVTVRREATRLLLSIQDDGKGFDPEQERGLGLLGMQERVSHLGGQFRITSERGLGTSLAVSLPLAESA